MSLFQKLFSFSGKISRKEYWSALGALVILIILVSIAGYSSPILRDYNILGVQLELIVISFVGFIVLISYLAIQVKRCNDLDWPRIAVILSLLPGFFIFWILILGIIESDKTIKILISKIKAMTSKIKDIEYKIKEDPFIIIEMMRNKEVINNNKLRKVNFETYAKYTESHNWQDICKLNNVNFDSFWTKKELEALPNYLEDGEVVFALTSGLIKQTLTSNILDFGLNTWLVVLTSERFLFIDCAMLSSSIDSQSVRHEHVQAVSSSQGFKFGKIMIDLGSRVIVIDNCKKDTVSIISNLANKWYRELKKQNTAQADSIETISESSLDKLDKLANLHSKGVLTEEEFNTAKGKILDRV